MGKKIKIISILIITLLLLGGTGVLALNFAPFYIYQSIIKSGKKYSWYKSSTLDEKYFRPQAPIVTSLEQEENNNLWKDYHIGDVILSLPNRHPVYLTVIELPRSGFKKDAIYGLRLLDQDQQELASLYFHNSRPFLRNLKGEKIFSIPVFKKFILSLPLQNIWEATFEHAIKPGQQTMAQMMFNLYLLRLRQVFFSNEIIRFWEYTENIKITEIESKNKDFTQEVIHSFIQGQIYSVTINTRKNDPNASKLRQRILARIRFSKGSTSLGKIIYREFKGLDYSSQIDQEGMLYLFSAWSHWPEEGIIRELIQYLEKGQGQMHQITPLYEYAFEEYGKTFTHLPNSENIRNQELLLQKSIELEDKKLIRREIIDLPQEVKPEEKIREKINRSKSP